MYGGLHELGLNQAAMDFIKIRAHSLRGSSARPPSGFLRSEPGEEHLRSYVIFPFGSSPASMSSLLLFRPSYVISLAAARGYFRVVNRLQSRIISNRSSFVRHPNFSARLRNRFAERCVSQLRVVCSVLEKL